MTVYLLCYDGLSSMAEMALNSSNSPCDACKFLRESVESVQIYQCSQDLRSKQRGQNYQRFGESPVGEEAEARYGWVGAISIRQR